MGPVYGSVGFGFIRFNSCTIRVCWLSRPRVHQAEFMAKLSSLNRTAYTDSKAETAVSIASAAVSVCDVIKINQFQWTL